MTFLLYGVAAALSATGTRAAAAVFAACAALAAISPSPGSAVIAWTGAMAGGLICAGVRPRRLAPAAIGAAAAVAAGLAGNAAVVLALWTVGTGAAVVSRPSGRDGARWAFGLLQADLLVAATVAYTAVAYGFAAWPERLGDVGAAVLLVSAFARVPAVGWAGERPELGLVLVRAQAVVLATVAIHAAGHELLLAVVVAGSAVFAVAPLARRLAVRDAGQEMALVSVALATTGLGWRPTGWVWGALAGGTLMHHLRLSGWSARTNTSVLARALTVSGGIGLPLLPAATATLAALLAHSRPLLIAVTAAIAAGLAGRAWSPTPTEVEPELEGLRGWPEAVVVVAVVASLGAPALSLPHPPGGDKLSWPPLWAAAVVVAVGVLGSVVPRLAPSVESRDRRRSPPAIPGLEATLRGLAPPGGEKTLAGLLVFLALLAAGVLVLGWARGFL